jgi:glyoxylase-like metal-dependent hydrolase (beta-lactamase superfamily II)
MLSQLGKNLYSFDIPLPGSPLKWINSYVIKGNLGEHNLIIDTGFNRPECLEALHSGMKALEIDPKQTDVFLTHSHSDHSGNAASLAKEGCHVLMGRTAYLIQKTNMATWEIKKARAMKEGMSAEIIKKMFASNPAILYAPGPYEAEVLDEGDVLSYGGYTLKCIATPGHTPGHMCLYDQEKQLMILGDHVLFDITPNISIWVEMKDALGEYLASLRKIRNIPVKIALPGHRTRGGMTMQERIDALLEHHKNRLAEAEHIIQNEPGINAYQIASKMTWRIKTKNWDEFPPGQKWFAIGETMTHLDYLLIRNRIIRKEDKDGNRTYYAK